MTSLLALAALYLLAALILILIIDRSVGMFFPASAEGHGSPRTGRRTWFGAIDRGSPSQVSEPFP